MIRGVFLLLIPFLLFAKINISTYPEYATNGEVIFIRVKSDKNLKFSSLKVKFRGRVYKSLENNQDIILPINYYTRPKTYKIKIFGKDNKGKKFKYFFDLKVKKGRYKSEKLRVSKRKTTYTKEILKEIKAERREATAIYSTYSPKMWNGKFIIPLKSKITDPYGKKRIFNGKIKSYHSGTDYRAKIGTPIVASNDGIVRLVKNRFFAGGSIILDHGNGIFTVYYHLSKFFVKKGDFVKKGEKIGLSGKSGRVTGPHLHFGVIIENTNTNPVKFIEYFNDMLADEI